MEKDKVIPEGYMTIGEVAKKMGVTVRALQYYDREGLLCPSTLSEGGRRLYNDKDIVELHHLLTFKSLGFSLKEIKNHLIAIDTPQKAIEALTKQGYIIQEKINELTQSLQTIEILKTEVQQMHSFDLKKYADIIINFQMGNKYYSLIKYFNDDLLDYCHTHFDKQSSIKFINHFNQIINKVECAIKNGVSPDSEQGLVIAKEFWKCINEFIGNNDSILPQLMNLANAQTNNIECLNMQKRMNEFIEPALNAYFKNLGINPFEVKNE